MNMSKTDQNYLSSTGFTYKKSSFTLLKEHQKQYKQNQQHQIKKINKLKYLKSQIDQNNNNIFQLLPTKKSMTAQNIIWQKKYQLKTKINSLKEQNYSLRAKIWNVEKENRKMEKQIQNWGLTSYIKNKSFSKPYIDTATVQKVFEDQDYSITSIKLQIIELEKQLSQKNELLKDKNKTVSNISNLKKDLNRTLCQKKTKFYQYFFTQAMSQSEDQTVKQQIAEQKIEEMKRKVKQQYIQKNNQIQILKKNAQVKRRSKASLMKEMGQLSKQFQIRKNINQNQIKNIKKLTEKLRDEDQTFITGQENKLVKIKEDRLHYECSMQDWMGGIIKKKMALKGQIITTRQNILKVQKEKEQLLIRSKNSII